jgi:hypothetical protein
MALIIAVGTQMVLYKFCSVLFRLRNITRANVLYYFMKKFFEELAMINLTKLQNVRNWQKIRTGAIATLLLAALSPIYATQKSIAAPQDLQNQYVSNAELEEVVEETQDYVGQVVTVRSEANKIDGSNSFKLDSEGLLGLDLIDDNELLVLNPNDIPFPAVEDDDPDVQVTGEVRSFVIADLEREFGIDLDPDLYVDYENKPVIIARSIALSPDPSDVTDNPEKYYGRAIAVEGEVDDIYSSSTFALDNEELFDSDDLLVINASSEGAIKEDENVVVVGELRSFVVADLERDYDLDWDLDLQRELELEYGQRPVMVVREVYPSAQ